jgi:putative phosphoesterase
MKIGIISDIHENFHNLILALAAMKAEGVEQILCLGDLMNDGIAKVLSISEIPVFMIWGNNDGDKIMLMRTALKPGSNLKVSNNTYDFLDYDGRKIFITHFDDLAEPMALSNRFDAVFFGHTHLPGVKLNGRCLIVNPGELSAQRTGKATVAVYDTKIHMANIITLDGSVTLKTEMVDRFLKDNSEKLGFRPGTLQ